MAKVFQVRLTKAASLTTPWGAKIGKGQTVHCVEGSREHSYYAGNANFNVSPVVDRAAPDAPSGRRKSRGEKRASEDARLSAAAKAAAELAADEDDDEDDDLEEESDADLDEDEEDAPSTSDLKKMRVKELREYATSIGLNIADDESKPAILKMIAAQE